jgi:hypothetical protein
MAIHIRRVLIEALKPRETPLVELAQAICSVNGVEECDIVVTSKEIKELAQEIAKRIPTVAEKYENIETDIDRETLLIKIYSETLKIQMNEDKWKPFFSKIKNMLPKYLHPLSH